MVSFLFYDITFLIVFSLFLIIFLYKKRKNLKREGLLYLYPTSFGIKLINYVGQKYRKTLYVLSYISVILGYILMVIMVYLMGKIVYLYCIFPSIVKMIKIPPIIPLVPYLPQIFKVDFLPPFYFTYWILIIAIIAITHEFAHGIFASYSNIKIKSTGFGFLGPFLAAFVEPDEKTMSKKSIFSQLSILSAGTFANVLTAIFFFVVLVIFFSLSFSPVGLTFTDYPYDAVNLSAITLINGISIENPSYDYLLEYLKQIPENKTKIIADGKSYIATVEILEAQSTKKPDEIGFIILYNDAPAINVGLKSENPIIEINGIEIKNKADLEKELAKYSPGEKINIKTISGDGEKKFKEYEVVLGEHPDAEGVAYLGVGFSNAKRSGILGRMYSLSTFFKEEHVYYAPKINGLSIFIYNLLWWIILISISVALINMLPLGIFDGGRVFYLTILAITKSENIAKKSLKGITIFILFLFLLLMFFYFLSFI